MTVGQNIKKSGKSSSRGIRTDVTQFGTLSAFIWFAYCHCISKIANSQTLNSLGPLCNQPLDCKCAPNVECLDDDKCGPCPPGYTGDGFECEKIRPCELEPCHPGNDFDF